MAEQTIPTLLVLKHKGVAGSPQVFRLHGGTTLVPVGPPIPDSLENPANQTSVVTNSVLQFGRDIYVVNRTNIWRLDQGNPTEGDETWVNVHTMSDLNTDLGYTQKTGLYIVNVGKTPTIIIAYQSTSNLPRMVTSIDGVTWTASGNLNTSGLSATGTWGKTEVYRNKLYCAFADPTVDVIEIDPQVQKATYINATSWVSATRSADLCVFDNRLWYIDWLNGGSDQHVGIGVLQNGTFVLQQGIVVGGFPDNSGSHATESAMALFTDGSDMYALIPGDDGSNAGGNFCMQLSLAAGPGSNLAAEVEITNSVMPTSLRPPLPAPGLYQDYQGRWFTFTDNSNPSNPCIHLWYQTTDNLGVGLSTYYRWNGPNTLMGIPAGTGQIGPTAGIAHVNTKHGGGERIWSVGQVNVEIKGRAAVENGQAFNFQVYSGEGTTLKKIRFWYNTEEGGGARLPATIRPTSIVGGMATYGADSISDYVDNVEANDTTIYCFIWDTVADGVEQADSVLLMPQIEEC